MMIRPVDRAVVATILRERLPSAARVWVFGSRARGTAKRGSDLDLLVDAGRPLTYSEKCDLESAFEFSDIPYRVDVVDIGTISGLFRESILEQRTEFIF